MIKFFKEKLVNICVLLISFMICLFLMEILVRMFLPQRIETPLDCFASDPLLGWKLKPNFNKLYSSADFIMNVVTNEKGFRDLPHKYERSQDSFRLLGIGDSFLFGYGVDYEDTVLTRLRKLIDHDRLIKKDVEAINLGIPGYNIEHYYELFRQEGYKYNPDLVILFFYSNDWSVRPLSEYNMKVNNNGFLLSDDKFSFESVRSFLFPLRIFLKRHSQLYILARDRFKTVFKKAKLMYIPEIDNYRKGNDLKNRFSYTFDVLKEINEFCKQRIGCPFMVCAIPEKMQVDHALLDIVIEAYNIKDNDYNWSQPQEELAEFCSKEKIYYLDLIPAFKDYEQKESFYFDIDPHWNKYGHSLAASKIFDFIKENKIIITE